METTSGSPPEKVYEMIATDGGRSKFWPEESVEEDGVMSLRFLVEPQPVRCKILETIPPSRFSFRCLGNIIVTFALEPTEAYGTDLLMTEINFPSQIV